MSGGSSSGSDSTTTKGFKATQQINPYYTTKTTKKGKTTTTFTNGSAGKTVYDFTNENLQSLLDSYLKPSIDDQTSQAMLYNFNKQQQANLQNGIINPLAQNNMIRSSQATNMYNNLSNQAADYTNNLIADSQNRIGAMLDRLQNMYAAGGSGAADATQTSINASLGGGTTTTKSSSKAK